MTARLHFLVASGRPTAHVSGQPTAHVSGKPTAHVARPAFQMTTNVLPPAPVQEVVQEAGRCFLLLRHMLQLTLFGKPSVKNAGHAKKKPRKDKATQETATQEKPEQDMVAEEQPKPEQEKKKPRKDKATQERPGSESAMERPVEDTAAKPGSATQSPSSSNTHITSFDPKLKRGHDPVCTRCGHHVDTCAPGVRLARKHPPPSGSARSVPANVCC